MTETEDLGAIQTGARLAAVLPYLKEELVQLEGNLITRVLQELNQRTLTPELAYTAWLELASYRGLSKRMDKKVKLGIGAGERQANTLAIRR